MCPCLVSSCATTQEITFFPTASCDNDSSCGGTFTSGADCGSDCATPGGSG